MIGESGFMPLSKPLGSLPPCRTSNRPFHVPLRFWLLAFAFHKQRCFTGKRFACLKPE
jgi:hypothetical protein